MAVVKIIVLHIRFYGKEDTFQICLGMALESAQGLAFESPQYT